MGFESAHTARRRLAAFAMTDERVSQALAPAMFPGLEVSGPSAAWLREADAGSRAPEVHHLDLLARDIVSTPGAGGALLVAFAAQARALALVLEATVRTESAARLPAEVMTAVENALRTPLRFDVA